MYSIHIYAPLLLLALDVSLKVSYFFYHPTCVPRILPTYGPRAFGKSFADGGVRGLLGRILIILLPK